MLNISLLQCFFNFNQLPADLRNTDYPVQTTFLPEDGVKYPVYNRKKNRPASSISEVLEEMERQQKAKGLHQIQHCCTVKAELKWGPSLKPPKMYFSLKLVGPEPPLPPSPHVLFTVTLLWYLCTKWCKKSLADSFDYFVIKVLLLLSL